MIRAAAVDKYNSYLVVSRNLQNSDDDVSQFDTKFTRQIPIDSPDDSTLSESCNMIFQVNMLSISGRVLELRSNCIFCLSRVSRTWHRLF